MGEEAYKLLENTVERWLGRSAVQRIDPVTPDASLRRYFRITLRAAEPSSVVAMIFDSVACPEYDVGQAVRTDDACVELTRFFRSYGIAVPELLYDARDLSVLLIEDLGDRLLIDALLEAVSGAVPQAEAQIETYYQQAVDQLVRLQSIPRESASFVFNRAFKAETYCREMFEFLDFVLRPVRISESEEKEVKSFFGCLAQTLDACPKVLAHRDFHSWNLLIDQQDRVRVIDFQDALLSTRCYDIVGLLNDRDTDAALGEERYERLLNYFSERIGSPPSWRDEYRRVLLQRDLKVAGRFCKLSRNRGLVHYERWVPGTLRRIMRTLAAICSEAAAEPFFVSFYALLQDKLGELAVSCSGAGAGKQA